MRRHEEADICRHNWKDVLTYLDYCRDVRQLEEGTLETYYYELRFLLEWAVDINFVQVAELRPAFPRWLDTQPVSADYARRVCTLSRAFFKWLKTEYPQRFNDLSLRWIESLQMKERSEGQLYEQELYTVDEVRELVALPADTLVKQRDRAAVAMLFLSGMRNGAFCSLPIKAVHLNNGTGMIQQWPALGVKTKFGKTANTWLLNIPDLKAIVNEWDEFIRDRLPGEALWFPHITREELIVQLAGKNRSFNPRLNLLCDCAGIPYRSVHKLRHGHVVWALERCQNEADRKAVSLNVMHNSVQVTDEVYSRLPSSDIQQRIGALMDVDEREARINILSQELFRLVRS